MEKQAHGRRKHNSNPQGNGQKKCHHGRTVYPNKREAAKHGKAVHCGGNQGWHAE